MAGLKGCNEPGPIWQLPSISACSLEDMNDPYGNDLFNTTGTVRCWMSPLISGTTENQVVNPD
jgi:hypothetical protein